MKERTARGTALVNLLPLEADERIQAVIDTRTYEDGPFLFFATKNGMVKKTKMQEYDSPLRATGSSPSTSSRVTSWSRWSRPTATTTSSWCRAAG